MVALDASATESSLRWGSPGVSRQANTSHISNDAKGNPLRASVRRDAHLVMAAWEEDDTAAVRQTASEQQSIVVERTSPIYGEPTTAPSAYDPFDEDDRLAQLPDDPFDDPFDEPAGDSTADDELDELPEEPIEDVEDALQQEMERRRSADDLFGEEMEESFEPETIDTDPIDELDDDPLGDDPLSDDPEDEELMQSEEDDWRTPDYDFGSEQQELTPEQLRQRSEELQREQAESEENCSEELEKIEADTISSIDLSIRVPGNAGEDYPYECAVSTGTHQPRQWPQITYNWKAAAICHKPLYFEQVQLERYGHSWGPYVQPIMSGVHFFGTIPILPYKMGIRTPRECVYTLGYYRPGSCAPYMIDPIPFTWRAALFQGGAVTGISFAIP